MRTPPLPETVADHLPQPVTIPIGTVVLPGILTLPPQPVGIVVFAQGSGSARVSARNRRVADALVRDNFGTLLFDLVSASEARDRAHVFDIPLLAERLCGATDWLTAAPAAADLPIAYFGASTGAAAALVATADREVARAVVLCGGRPDLAGDVLPRVRVPTLLIVGGADLELLALNRAALTRLGGIKRLALVPGATHLFEETDALDRVAALATLWFRQHLGATPAALLA